MRFLTLVLALLLSCKSIKQTDQIRETKAIVIIFDKDNIFLFPVEAYDAQLSLAKNLNNTSLTDGRALNFLTENQYGSLLNNAKIFKRSDVPDDFSDRIKFLEIVPVRVKFKDVIESNPQAFNDKKKNTKQKIELEDTISFYLVYNFLGVELLEIEILQ